MTKKLVVVLTSMMIAAMFLSACTQPLPTVNPTDEPQQPSTAPTAFSSTSGQGFGIGSTQISSKDGMTMLYVPAGDFLMGSLKGEGLSDEHPQHTVYLDAYWIDQTEVTNTMFSTFVTVTNYQTDAEKAGKSDVYTGTQWIEVTGADWQHPQGPSSNLSGLDDHPVVFISWYDAQAYCEWAGRSLPTEAQWEKAARGTDGRAYPWGEKDPTQSLANYGSNVRSTTKVGSYIAVASPYGAMDMSGNVWEWVADWFDANYYKNSTGSNPTGPVSGKQRVLRGGSWQSFMNVLRTALRYRDNPLDALNDYGFRCVLGASS